LVERGYSVIRLSYDQVMGEWLRVIAVIRSKVARREHRWSARHRRAGFGGV
jgi:very-short-patch-repair endonuclease